MRKYVVEQANQAKAELVTLLKNKLICIKFDCATRLKTNYLGVNVRFPDKDGIGVTRTIAVVDTQAQHTAASLKRYLLCILQQYEIKPTQILCAVTDNASNMVKLVADINKELQNESRARAANDDEGSDTEDELEDEVEPGTLDLASLVPASVTHQPCAAHTMELAMNDGLKNTRADHIIGCARHVCKVGRNAETLEIIKKRTGKVLFVDVETRWGSTFMMIERLLELRPIVQECEGLGNKEMKLLPIQWEELGRLKNLLGKGFEVTKKLQFSDCSPGYFYRKWSGLVLYYERTGVDSALAKEIARSMRRREQKLLSDDLLLAAVLIDVKHAECLLDQPLEDRAIKKIVEVVLRLKSLDGEEMAPEEEVPCEDSDANMESDEEFSALRKGNSTTSSGDGRSQLLRSVSQDSDSDAELPSEGDFQYQSDDERGNPSLSRLSSTVNNIKILTEQKLAELKEQRHRLMKLKKPIYEIIRDDYPTELKQVAFLLTAMPVTQVCHAKYWNVKKNLFTVWTKFQLTRPCSKVLFPTNGTNCHFHTRCP